MSTEPETTAQRWAALKDHLTSRAEQDLTPAAATAIRNTLAKMRELEAGR